VLFRNTAGTAQPNDFKPSVGGTVVVSGAKNTYTSNSGGWPSTKRKLTGYQFVNITGDKCPGGPGRTVTLAPGDDITCTITNVDQPAQLTVSTQVSRRTRNTSVSVLDVSDRPAMRIRLRSRLGGWRFGEQPECGELRRQSG